MTTWPTGSPTPATTAPTLHPDTRLGPVALRVAQLDRSLRFYETIIGFERISLIDGVATLGVAGEPLLILHEQVGARPVPERATGLYHFAILTPSRAALGHALTRLIQARIPVGQGDHLVSEALYLSDPDGNGIEIYRDRPRERWNWQNGRVQMATNPVDINGLLLEAQQAGPDHGTLHPGTVIGHVHLKVGDIPGALAFYHGILGFDVVADMPSALFVSAGGYHHHLGLNTWHSRGAGPAPTGTAGLEAYTIIIPNADELAGLLARLQANGIAFEGTNQTVTLSDPWQNTIILQLPAA